MRNHSIRKHWVLRGFSCMECATSNEREVDMNLNDAVAVEAAVAKKAAKKAKGVRKYKTKTGWRFQAQVRVAGRDPISQSFATVEEANEWLRAELAKKPEPKVDAQAGPGEMTMHDLLTFYVDESDRRGIRISDGIRMMVDRLK